MTSEGITLDDDVTRHGLGESGGECLGDLFGGGLSGSDRQGDDIFRLHDDSPQVAVDVLLVAPEQPLEFCCKRNYMK